MDEERIKKLVIVAGQYLRREYPVENGLSGAMIEMLEEMRRADLKDALRAARSEANKRS